MVVDEGVPLGSGVSEILLDSEIDEEGVREGVVVIVGVRVREPLLEKLVDELSEMDGVGVLDALSEILSVIVGVDEILAPVDKLAVGVLDSEILTEIDREADSLGGAEIDCVLVREDVRELDPVGVGVPVTVSLIVGVTEGSRDSEIVGVRDSDTLEDPVTLIVGVEELLPVLEILAVREILALCVTGVFDAVSLIELENEIVGEGDTLAPALRVPVGELDGDSLLDAEGVADLLELSESEALAVDDGDSL